MASGDDDERAMTRHELAHLLAKAKDMAQAKTPGAADTVRVGTPPANVGADVTTIAGTVPVKSENLSSADQISVTGDGSAFRPLEGSGGGAGVLTDDDTIEGDGTPGDEIALKRVYTDGTMTGLGTPASPLHATGSGEGVNINQDNAPILNPATTVNVISGVTKPIGLTAADSGGGVAALSTELAMDAQFNAPGDPAVDVDLTKWFVQLNNSSEEPEAGDALFTLPTPTTNQEITVAQGSSTNNVSVAVPDLAGGADTFVGQAQGDSLTFIGFGGVWWKKSQVGFAG